MLKLLSKDIIFPTLETDILDDTEHLSTILEEIKNSDPDFELEKTSQNLKMCDQLFQRNTIKQKQVIEFIEKKEKPVIGEGLESCVGHEELASDYQTYLRTKLEENNQIVRDIEDQLTTFNKKSGKTSDQFTLNVIEDTKAILNSVKQICSKTDSLLALQMETIISDETDLKLESELYDIRKKKSDISKDHVFI